MIDLSRLRDTPFALSQRGSTLRERIDPLFEQAGFHPKVIMESAKNEPRCKLAAQQVCCTIAPQAYATDHKNLVWFSLPTLPRFSFYAVHKKGTRPDRAMSDLISLFRSYAQQHFQNPIP
jgi:DNA-binding transcriptional LysR family regulator